MKEHGACVCNPQEAREGVYVFPAMGFFWSMGGATFKAIKPDAGGRGVLIKQAGTAPRPIKTG